MNRLYYILERPLLVFNHRVFPPVLPCRAVQQSTARVIVPPGASRARSKSIAPRIAPRPRSSWSFAMRPRLQRHKGTNFKKGPRLSRVGWLYLCIDTYPTGEKEFGNQRQHLRAQGKTPEVKDRKR